MLIHRRLAQLSCLAPIAGRRHHPGGGSKAPALLAVLVLAAFTAGPAEPAGAEQPAHGARIRAVTGTPGGSSADAATAYRAPVVGPLRVIRPFIPPATRYSAGHRGVDLRSGPGGQVLAAGPGTVRFVGNVAGRGVVVLQHSGGISTEYEPLALGPAKAAGADAAGGAGGSGAAHAGDDGIAVHVGQPVAAGARLGAVAGAHGACGPSQCLHWGARRGAEYFDPLTLLQPLGPLRLAPTARV